MRDKNSRREKEKGKEKEEIKVVDKRRFAGGGEEAQDREAEEDKPVRGDDTAQKPSAGAEGACAGFPDKMDFITFILSMSQTALLAMGCGPNPETGKTDCDLRSAKCTIDILEVLQEKTKGNLTGEEERILERILTELRLMWVDKKRQMSEKKG
jgi:hypothetical protein